MKITHHLTIENDTFEAIKSKETEGWEIEVKRDSRITPLLSDPIEEKLKNVEKVQVDLEEIRQEIIAFEDGKREVIIGGSIYPSKATCSHETKVYTGHVVKKNSLFRKEIGLNLVCIGCGVFFHEEIKA